jgi:hypothetical protein
MKISGLAKSSKGPRVAPLKRRVLEYVNSRPDEVFGYRDSDLTRELSIKPGALSFTLWSLTRDGLIGKTEVAGHVYFGSHKAIAELVRKAGGEADDPWARARRIRDRIYEREGYIDTLELLDAARNRAD